MTPLYTGIGGVVRELTEVDAGIGGVVTPLTEMWAGVDGVQRQIFSGGYQMASVTNNFSGFIYGVQVVNGLLAPISIGLNQTKEVVLGSIVFVFSGGISGVNVSGDAEYSNMFEYEETHYWGYIVNGNCTFTKTGGGGGN